MTNCEWLLKENKLEEFMHDYTSLVIYLATRDTSKDLKGLEEIYKFREKYPTCHIMGPVTLVFNVSQWLMSEKEVAPVNHCKLIREKIGNRRMTVCTNCQTADGQFYPNGCMHYCPYCGAIVDSMELE